jgi:hypothetical protein
MSDDDCRLGHNPHSRYRGCYQEQEARTAAVLDDLLDHIGPGRNHSPLSVYGSATSVEITTNLHDDLDS